MKQYLYILGFIIVFSGLYTSCKKNTLDALHEDEVIALDNYVKSKELTDYKDASGIYYKNSILGTDTTKVRSGFKVYLYFKITLLDGTVIFSTEDKYGHNYEAYDFYVDATDATITAAYVQQIAGLHSGLKKMHVGDTAFMVIPSEYAYKAVDNTSIIGVPRFSTLLATVYVKKGISPAELAAQ